jgi:hypothetical protein
VNRPGYLRWGLVGVLVLVGVLAMVLLAGPDRHERSPWDPSATSAVPAQPVDPSNEGRLVEVSGTLEIGESARDTQLGVSKDVLVLVREVEMFQWYEDCAAQDCTYDRKWTAHPVDSAGFREPAGHENPGRFPFSMARFEAGAVRLGDFEVDPGFAAHGRAATDLAVGTDQLPPNLAATFRGIGGLLYAGNDPEHPAVGDLRVSYRAVPGGAARLVGIQRGRHLLAPGTEPAAVSSVH